jgi:hypothetical protein
VSRRDPASERTLDDEGMPDLDGPLDEKVVTGDPQEGLAPPNDAPRASVDFGTTAEEQRHGESLDMRIAREVPDDAAEAAAGTSQDDVPELVGDPVLDDHEAELVDEDVRQSASLGHSAEEDAIHVVDEGA